VTDLTFYGLDGLGLGTATILVARIRHVGDRSATAAALAIRRTTRHREGRLAMSFGIPLRWWLVLRALVLLLAVMGGLLSRVPVVMVVAVLVGLFGFPWSLEGLALGRRIAMARDLGKALAHMRTRLDTTGQSLDVVLRDVASRRQGSAARIFAPIATARDVDSVLAQSVSRSGLSVAEDAYMVTACARTRPPQLLGHVIGEIEVPAIDSAVEFMEKSREWRVGERAQAWLLAALSLIVYWVLDQDPKIHAYHASASGQMWLVVSALIFALSLRMLSRQHRMEEPEGWDTITAHRELEKLRRG
jgi:hypothetical protein